ncbi:MAG TPA: fibronectin type III domain-containing protein [Jatrophihabitantaceae bacterium]|jgi:hypothetical protein
MRRLRVLAIVIAIVSLGGTAWAYWGALGSGVGTAQTGALNPPTTVTVPATSTGTVHVTWTASTGTPLPTGYRVTRVLDSTDASAVACDGPVTGTACDDQSVPDGSYHYTVTAVYRSWTATSAASSSVVVQTPTQLAFTAQPSTTTASSAITPGVAVTVKDAAGAAVPAAGIQVAVALGTNPSDGTLSGTLTATTNSSGVASFGNLSIDKASVGYTLTASSGSLVGAISGSFTVTAAAAARFVITSQPVSGTASTSATLGPITVARQDAYGNPVNAPAGGAAVNLTSSSSGARFAATSGGAAVSSITFPAGTSSTTFYYGDTTVGPPTITASGALTSATQTETITPAAATRLVFTTAPVSGTAAQTAVLGPITVQTQDAFGNPVNAPVGGRTVNLASDSTGTKLFAASLNGPGITSVTIPAGSSSTTFFYGDTKAGTPTITASSTGLTNASQLDTITAAAPGKLCLAPSSSLVCVAPLTLPKNATSSLYVVLHDQWENVATATSTITVTLSSTNGTIPSGMTIAAGQSNGVFSFKPPNGSATGIITATASPLTGVTVNYTAN